MSLMSPALAGGFFTTSRRLVEKKKQLKIELPYDAAIPLLCLYPEEAIIQKDTCATIFSTALFTIAKTRKQLNVHQQRKG